MKRLIVLLLISSGVLSSGCSMTGETPPPPPDKLTRFIEHPEQVKPRRERYPFMLSWTVDDKNPASVWGRYQKVTILPVDLSYFEADPNSPKLEDVKKVAEYTQAHFQDAIQTDDTNRLALATDKGPGTLVTKIALVRLHSTAAYENIATDAAGLFIPGAILVSTAAGAAGGAAVREFTSGEIAIAVKVVDGKDGTLLAEFYDERGDRAALVNVEDYSTLGNAKVNIEDWAKEFVEVLNAPPAEKVSGPSQFALLLW